MIHNILTENPQEIIDISQKMRAKSSEKNISEDKKKNVKKKTPNAT